MSSRSLNDLIPEVALKARQVKEICIKEGKVELLIYCTLRSLSEQARLYRQSRSLSTIKAKMKKMSVEGYGFIAEIIDQVGPCNGPHVTDAAPGESWHNYGQAFDAVPLVDGKPLWSISGIDQVESSICPTCGHHSDVISPWKTYGEAVRQAGLYWAGDWTTFKEYPHAQLMTGSNPLKVMNPQQVKKALQERGLL